MVSLWALSLWLTSVNLTVLAKIHATENTTTLSIQNDRLSFTFDKTTGFLGHIHLDGQDLQGPQSNSSGRGYYECHCVPEGYQVDASDIFLVGQNASFELLQGHDGYGVAYAGVFMQEALTIGHTFRQWYFLRDGETGLHNFAQLKYHNSSAGLPFEGGIPVREIRTVIQFNTTLWETASTNPTLNVTIPSQHAIDTAVQAQDATWSLDTTPDEPYVQQTSQWWTKYFIADSYRNRKAHGLYGVTNGTAYGAWQVSVTQDTLFGGPTHYDLLLDGMIGVPERTANLQRIPHIYYYFASSHQGAATSNLTSLGYDRTWGPQLLYFNKGTGISSSLAALRADAESHASYSRYSSFYDSITQHVPGFTPSISRGSLSATIDLPDGAQNAIAILSANGIEYQSNVLDNTAFQYWSEVGNDGTVELTDVKHGVYRLTIFAKGVFGTFVRDDVKVSARQKTQVGKLKWISESAGQELWRIGTPDRTAGEFRHGYELDTNKTYHPQEYRSYWGKFFATYADDFPQGVRFEVGRSVENRDWSYVQWADGKTTAPGIGPLNLNFTILFNITQSIHAFLSHTATFTVQLAGATGATGNEDWIPVTEFANIPLYAHINNQSELLEWIIPSNISSSCVERSGVECFFTANKWRFPVSWLREGLNTITLGLAPNSGTRVMYDALRLEIDGK